MFTFSKRQNSPFLPENTFFSLKFNAANIINRWLIEKNIHF